MEIDGVDKMGRHIELHTYSIIVGWRWGVTSRQIATALNPTISPPIGDA